MIHKKRLNTGVNPDLSVETLQATMASEKKLKDCTINELPEVCLHALGVQTTNLGRDKKLINELYCAIEEALNHLIAQFNETGKAVSLFHCGAAASLLTLSITDRIDRTVEQLFAEEVDQLRGKTRPS